MRKIDILRLLARRVMPWARQQLMLMVRSNSLMQVEWLHELFMMSVDMAIHCIWLLQTGGERHTVMSNRTWHEIEIRGKRDELMYPECHVFESRETLPE